MRGLALADALPGWFTLLVWLAYSVAVIVSLGMLAIKYSTYKPHSRLIRAIQARVLLTFSVGIVLFAAEGIVAGANLGGTLVSLVLFVALFLFMLFGFRVAYRRTRRIENDHGREGSEPP